MAESERNDGDDGGGEGLTSTRIRACGHVGWTTGRLARRPLRPTPGIRRLHRHRTRTLPFTPSRTAVTTADHRNFIRKPTAAKRKMEIYF